MLPDPLRLLLVAFAAGDLSPRRRHAAERLLKHSPEARELLAGLLSDSELLSQVPVLTAPRDLEDRILRRIPGAATVEPTVLARPPRWPLFVSTFVAASVMLGVTVVTWSMLTISKPKLPVEPMTVVVDAPIDRVDDPNFGPTPSEPNPRTTVQARPLPPVTTPTPNESVLANSAKPESAPAVGSEFASPPRDLPEPVQLVLPRLPEVFGVHALNDAAVCEKFVSELARADVHRIDLFCRDSGKALERLQAALKQIGVRALSDSAINEIQKRRIRCPYLVFTGDLNAAEWGRLLQIAGAADRKAEEKKPGDGVLDQMVLMPIGHFDQKELQTWMGHDPLLSLAKPADHDPRRPIADETADAIARSIGKANAGKSSRMSIAIAMPPGRTTPANTSEIRQFLESRQPRVPGTISVMLVIRMG